MLTAGMDFGTTNSSVGYNNGSDARLVKLYKGGYIDRTSIFYSFENNGIPTVGEEGYQEVLLGERGRFITSPKKFLSQEDVLDVQVLHQRYSLVDVISHIVKSFKLKLENEIGKEIDSILVGRPVRFHDTNIELDVIAEDRLREAFLKASFKNVEFQYEPIGAFRAYANENPYITQNNNKTLIIDLGGGTSDFSLFDINNGKIDILGNYGIYVGGDVIDKLMIYRHFSKNLGRGAKQRIMNGSHIEIPHHIFLDFSEKSKLLFFREHQKLVHDLIPLLTSKDEQISLGRLAEIFGDLSKAYDFHSQIEGGKIQLTTQEKYTFNFPMFKNSFSKELSRDIFNEIIAGELEKIKNAICEILAQTNIKPQDINNAIINGGTGQIPVIREMVNNILGQGKLIEGNDLSSVGYGLTLESYERFR